MRYLLMALMLCAVEVMADDLPRVITRKSKATGKADTLYVLKDTTLAIRGVFYSNGEMHIATEPADSARARMRAKK